jgi:hypothetical protein
MESGGVGIIDLDIPSKTGWGVFRLHLLELRKGIGQVDAAHCSGSVSIAHKEEYISFVHEMSRLWNMT